MLEGPKLGELGSLLNVAAGLWAGALVLEGSDIGDIGSLFNLQLAGLQTSESTFWYLRAPIPAVLGAYSTLS